MVTEKMYKQISCVHSSSVLTATLRVTYVMMFYNCIIIVINQESTEDEMSGSSSEEEPEEPPAKKTPGKYKVGFLALVQYTEVLGTTSYYMYVIEGYHHIHLSLKVTSTQVMQICPIL